MYFMLVDIYDTFIPIALFAVTTPAGEVALTNMDKINLYLIEVPK